MSVDAGNTSKLGADGKIFTPATALPADVVRGRQNTTAVALTLWTGTKAQYDAIATKSTTTVYVVTGTPTYDPMAGSPVTADQKPIIEPKAT